MCYHEDIPAGNFLLGLIIVCKPGQNYLWQGPVDIAHAVLLHNVHKQVHTGHNIHGCPRQFSDRLCITLVRITKAWGVNQLNKSWSAIVIDFTTEDFPWLKGSDGENDGRINKLDTTPQCVGGNNWNGLTLALDNWPLQRVRSSTIWIERRNNWNQTWGSQPFACTRVLMLLPRQWFCCRWGQPGDWSKCFFRSRSCPQWWWRTDGYTQKCSLLGFLPEADELPCSEWGRSWSIHAPLHSHCIWGSVPQDSVGDRFEGRLLKSFVHTADTPPDLGGCHGWWGTSAHAWQDATESWFAMVCLSSFVRLWSKILTQAALWVKAVEATNCWRLPDMRVSINGGTPKSSTLIGFSLINHPFWGTPVPPFMETPKWEPQLPSIKHPALTSPRCLGARRCGLRSRGEPHHPQGLGAGQQDGLVFKNGPLLCLMWKIPWKVLKWWW